MSYEALCGVADEDYDGDAEDYDFADLDSAATGWSEIVGDGGLISQLFSAGGELTQKIVDNVSAQKKAEEEGKHSAAALAASIAADNNATEANAKLLVSQDLKLPSVQADALAAQLAVAAQDTAAAGLSPDNQKARGDAAQKALKDATVKWQAAAKNSAAAKAAEARVKACQMTYAKTQNSLIQQGLPPGPSAADIEKAAGGSWLTRPVLGPLPGAAVLVGGAAVASLGVVLLKKMLA